MKKPAIGKAWKKAPFFCLNVLCLLCLAVIALGFGASALAAGEEQELTIQQIHEIAEECPVSFEDPFFLVAVSDSLNCDVRNLTEGRLEKVKSLTIVGNERVEEIGDLRLFPNLETVTIKECGVRRVPDLSGLPHLLKLNLSNNQIRDLSDMGRCDSLVELNLSHNRIEDISALSNLTHVVKVDLAENRITSADALNDMRELEIMDLKMNQIRQMPEIRAPHLKKLVLQDNLLTDISFMEGNRTITSLDISYNRVHEISGLATCPNLEELYLYGYSRMDLSPLENMPSFHSIFLSQVFERDPSINFLIGNFKTADRYSKAYLIAKEKGLDSYE